MTTLTLKVGISMSKDNNITGKDKRPAVPATQTKAFTPLEETPVRPTKTSGLRRRLLTGFTFIEVIIALAIVSISMLALLRLNLTSIRMVETAEATSQAVSLADEKIAEILAAGYPKLESSSGTVERNGLTLNWQTQVIDAGLPQLSQVDTTGLRSVLVDVSFKQGTGNKHLQMSTYVADRKLNEQ